jgi:hypothetical protein
MRRLDRRILEGRALCTTCDIKYRVVAGESLGVRRHAVAAKLIAGEWQAERTRTVEIVRQQGRMKRWKATLEPDGAVRLDNCSTATDCPTTGSATRAGKAKAMAALIDREIRTAPPPRDSDARRRRTGAQRAVGASSAGA